jgi:hypothetical protein
MSGYPNDGRFPEDEAVEVRYPLPGGDDADRKAWPWLPGYVVQQCDRDEWQVLVEDRRLAEIDPEARVPADTPLDELRNDQLTFPLVFRDSSEIRRPEDASGG